MLLAVVLVAGCSSGADDHGLGEAWKACQEKAAAGTNDPAGASFLPLDKGEAVVTTSGGWAIPGVMDTGDRKWVFLCTVHGVGDAQTVRVVIQ